MIVVTVVLVAVFRYTRYGLATRAAAGNEKGALLLGISPDRQAMLSWAAASILAGLAIILIEPIAGLNPSTTALPVVPALAAALPGRLESFVITTATGLAIGMAQSLILGWSVRPDTRWLPDWLSTNGLQQAVPVIVIITVLALRGYALPDRAAIVGHRLPPSPQPRHVTVWTVGLVGLCAVGLLTFDVGYRQALVISLIFALLTLSVVVVTGYTGQISLAQLAFAGTVGFAAIKLAEDHVPFPIALVLAAALATAIGVAVAWPVTRVRGMTLAIATLAIAVAIEELLLASPSFSGGQAGTSAPRPSLFGLDIGFSALGADNFRPAFGFVCLGVLTLAAVAVANLRRNRTGLRWLAVRANERARRPQRASTSPASSSVPSRCRRSWPVCVACSWRSRSPRSHRRRSWSSVRWWRSRLTYLAGVSSVGGALLAGALAQAGIVTALLEGPTGGEADRYLFAISGVLLVVTVIVAPEGITGLVRNGLHRLRRSDADGSGVRPAMEPAA